MARPLPGHERMGFRGKKGKDDVCEKGKETRGQYYYVFFGYWLLMTSLGLRVEKKAFG